MTHIRSPILISVLAFVGLFVSQPASGDDRLDRVLLDTDLRAIPIELMSIGPNGISFSTPEGRVRVMSLDEVAAIFPPRTARLRPPNTTSGLWVTTTLVDGQVLIGRIRSTAGDDALSLSSDRFGDLDIPLERIASVQRQGIKKLQTGPLTAPAADDLVRLANGDTRRGFVEQLGPDVIIDEDGQQLVLPIDRVEWIQLANPPEPRQGVVLWLRSGESVHAESLALEGEELVITLSGGMDSTSRISLADILGANFNGERLIPLASLPIAEAGPTAGRRWTAPPSLDASGRSPLDAHDIHIPGPARLAWELPVNADRISGEITISEDAGPWTDFAARIVAITRDGQEVALATESSISNADPVFAFAAAIPERAVSVVIEIQAGKFGPIQDHAIIRRALLSTSTSDQVR